MGLFTKPTVSMMLPAISMSGALEPVCPSTHLSSRSHVSMLVTLDNLANETRALVTTVQSLPERLQTLVAAAIAAAEPERLIRSELVGAVRHVLEETDTLDLPARIDRNGTTLLLEPNRSPTTSERPTAPLRTHRGRLARGNAPSRLPNGTLYSVWVMWFCGTPPLRLLKPFELSTKDERKRLSDLKFVMNKMVALVPGFKSVQNPSPAQAYEAYAQPCAAFELSRETPTGRSRRIDQIRWTSVATLLREQDKQRRGSN